MKKLATLLVVCCLSYAATAQTITITDFSKWPENIVDNSYKFAPEKGLTFVINKIDKTGTEELRKNSSITGTLDGAAISVTKLDDKKYDGESFFKQVDNTLTIKLTNVLANLKDKDSVVFKFTNKSGGKTLTFTVTKEETKKPDDPNKQLVPNVQFSLSNLATNQELQDFFKQKYEDLKLTDVGYRDKNSRYLIHIFLDQLGNPLFSSIPTGIQRKYKYKIHVLYLRQINNLGRFMIKQTSGSLNDQSVYYNANVVPSKTNDQQAEDGSTPDEKGVADREIVEQSFVLLPTSDDLSFSLNFFKGGNVADTTTLTSYTIKKTSFYSGSFDVGIMHSWLSNPTFTSVNLPTDATKQTLKVTENRPGISGSFMYTVYVSPWTLIFPKDYKGVRHSAWGRSYLDDEKSFLRKIYPSFGVGLNGEFLTNWFAGLNFQPIQGFGVFVGKNIRKVNTFEMPDINPGTTVINADQFSYYQNTKTKADWTLGILIDTNIFNKLFGAVSGK